MWFIWLAAAMAADLVLVLDGTGAADGFSAPVTDEVKALSRGRDTTVEALYAGFDAESAETALDAALASDARVVAVIGPLVSGLVLAGPPPTKPVIAALALSEAPAPEGVVVLRLEDQIDEALDQLSHIVGSDAVALALPPYLVPLAGDRGQVVALDPSTAPTEVDGVLIGAIGGLDASQRAALLSTWTDAGVATLLLGGRSLPEHAMGVFIDTGESHPISRRVALTAVDLLEGRSPSGGTVAFRRGDLVLSAEVLRRLDLSPPFDVWADADVIGWEDQATEIGMFDAIAEGLVQSPALAGTVDRLAGENTAVATARSSWWPQADASATLTTVDPNVASAFQPQSQVQANASASQLVWSDAVATNNRVQSDLSSARDAELSIAEQDLAYDIATAFVNLERARAVIDVRAADIDRARLSLKVAQQRRGAGDASVSEVSRWEAEVANARASLVEAWTNFRASMIVLNQLRGTRVDLLVLPAGNGIEVGEDLARRLDNPRALDALASLASDVAVDRAPELRQLRHGTAAQERLQKLSQRAYWMPTVAAQGGLTFNIYQTPSDPIELPGAGPIELINNPPVFWSAGASASVPLFSGGSRRADQQKAGYDLASLEHQREQIALALRSRAVIAVNQAHGASWRSRLRREAAEAAARSLDAALGAYAAGTATQTTVTEARTSALQLQLAATDADYETTLRIIDLLRATASLPTPAQPDAPLNLRTTLTQGMEATP